MSQTFLDENPPMILDATCSYTHIWPKHATIRMDIRPEVKPDIVGDIRQTNFPDNYFDEIYVDPPHIIRNSPFSAKLAIKRRMSGRFSVTPFQRYGVFKSRKEWLDFLDRVNIELVRILKKEGRVHWKLTFGRDNTYIKETDLECLTNFEIIKKRVTQSKANWSRDKTNPVYWLTMKPKVSL